MQNSGMSASRAQPLQPAKGVREKETDLARDRESTTEQKGQYGCPGSDEGERTLASAGDRAVPWVY